LLFNSPEYAVFLLVCLGVYYAVGRARSGLRIQNLFLLGASYVFYGWWDYRFLSLIMISTVVDFVAGRIIAGGRASGSRVAMRRGLLVTVVSNLGILGFFKYFGFFVESAAALLDAIGLPATPSVLEILLPIGISFYTFQTLSYSIDIYRGRLEPVDDFFEFALFVAFFPQLVAGPIERARRLLPQIAAPRRPSAVDLYEGAWLIVLGLFRKVAIADTAAVFVDRAFANPQEHGSLALSAALVLYALQIYCDFAGYSNIARGSAKLLGFELIRNFQHPYFSRNPREFWRRWHISLSTWLRDYLYISLGGNRRGAARTYGALMLTMLLGGLWHGASWNFVLWGGLHGAYLVIHRAVEPVLPRLPANAPAILRMSSATVRALGTFALVCGTWLFFRSSDMETTRHFLAGLVSGGAFDWHLLAPTLILWGCILAIDVPQAITRNEHIFARLPIPVGAFVASVLIVLTLFAGTPSVPFIYFQF